MIQKYKLFFTPACPNCPKVKAYMKKVKLEREDLDASTEAGIEEAQKLNVMSVPTVIFFDEEGKEVSRGQTLEEIKRITENRSLI